MRDLGIRILLIIIIISFVLGSGGSSMAYAALPVSEAGLKQNGASYEINPDAAGKLWVTDYLSGEIWGIDPVTGGYDAFVVGGSPVDGRHAGDYVWWVDYIEPIIGRVATSDGSYRRWEIIDTSALLSTFIDAQGRIYATDLDRNYMYRLDPAKSGNNLCRYALPPSQPDRPWINEYMVGSQDYLWIADWWGQLLRLKLSDNSAKVWTLTTSQVEREPIGVALDNQGNIWYADPHENVLGMLNPDANQVTIYPVPVDSDPTMITSQLGFIWYTDSYLGTFGRLDPLIASHSIFTPTSATLDMTPTCSTLASASTGTISKYDGTLSWAKTGYSTLVYSNGWRVHAMPEGSAPWGITTLSSGYVVDSLHNILSRFPLEDYIITLPVVIK